MAGKTAILSIRILADGKQAGREFSKTNTQIEKFDAGARAANVGAGILVAGIGLLAVEAGKSASALQQATGAVESVFGAHAAEAKKYAAEAAQNVGLATSEYSQLAAVIGAQLKNMGTPMSGLATQTNDLVALGGDLAATFGGTTADAVAALSSLLRGERDPIERYGVSIKQADVNARLAATGMGDLEGAALRAAETQATLALLTEQTADANGQFAREADTAAGAQQRANAEWENAQAALGEALLPVMAELSGMLSDVAGWVSENVELTTLIVGVIGGFAAGILILNGAIAAYRTIATIATAAQVVWNIAMSANPIGILVTGIGLLIGALVLMITNWEEVGKVVADIWDGIIGWLADGISWIQDAIGWLGELFGMQNSGPGNAGAGGGGVGGFDVPPHAPAWTPFDDVLLSAYAADRADGQDGTGGWDGWAAPYTSARSAAAPAGDTINVTVNGAIDVDATARQLEGILTAHARRAGRSATITGGGTRWR